MYTCRMSLRPGAVNFEEKWRGLRETLGAVVQLQRVRMITWNDHYSDIYALCEAFPLSYAERLYTETQTFLEVFVGGVCQQLLPLDSHSMLVGYQRHWLSYQQGAKYLNNLFSYFNRVPLKKYQPSESIDYALPGIYVPQLTGVSQDAPVEIRHMALRVWKQEMVERVREPLVKALLQEIQKDYEGDTADLTVVRDIIFSFIEVEEYNKESPLKFYQSVFETPFLSETGEHYRQEASKIAAELSCSEYMEHVVLQLQAARTRGQRFLHQTSITKFIRECEGRLVVDYMETYLYAHCLAMVQGERKRDLSNLFVLLNGIPRALDPVIAEFEDHVRSQGLSALSRLQLDKNPSVQEFISTVLGIHRKFHTLVRDVFGSHRGFYSALDRACRAFVNISDKPKQHSKAPILLARYCDQLLRKSSKGIGEQEVEDKLEEAITVFRYVDEKDMFQRFYSKMLSRRLVQALSLSMEAEESMIQKLKHACGYEYTMRLQRMVVDMKLSSDCMVEFQDHLKASCCSLSIGFSSLVLQSAAWPLNRMQCGFTVPEELVLAISRFESFYVQKHNGRKLSWLHHMSIGEMKMGYLKRPYTVCVTTFQMATLLAFNQADLHTYSSLLQCTQLGDQELSATIQSLVDSKLLLLGDGEVVGPDSIVKLNKSYSNKRTKFKVTAALQKDTQQEMDQTQFSVQEDRKLHIQAAIVRVMKARKLLKHNALIEETISQVKTRFTPNVPMIKRCIETLIDKQYLERDQTSRDMYSYVA